MAPLYVSFLAYVVLTAALCRSGWGTYEQLSLALIVGALAITLIGLLPSPNRNAKPAPANIFFWLLGAFVIIELVLLGRMPTSPYRADEQLPMITQISLGVIGALVASYAWPRLPGGRWRLPLILLVYFVIGALAIRSWPDPGIDVWTLQQDGAGNLIHGRNPYSAEYANPYDDEVFFGPGVVKDGRIQSFPYPPLNLLLDIPGYLAADVRWSLLLASLLTAVVMVAICRRLGMRAGHPAELAAVALLCHPRGLFVLEMAWTEPFLALAIAASVWALAGRKKVVSVLALAAAISVKQYGLLWLPAAWSSGRVTWRTAVGAMLLSLVLVVPFVCWDPQGFYRGVVRFHLVSPFRDDSLSILAAVFRRTGWQPPAAIGFIAAGLVALLVLWRSARTLAGSVLGAAAIYLAFFAFNKAAHMNYYWFADALLALAMITAVAESTVSSGDESAGKGLAQTAT